MVSNRRDVLKSIGGGVSATGLVALTGVVSGAERSLLVARTPDEKVFESVPKKWDDHRAVARAVNDRVSARYVDHPGVKSIGMVAGERVIDGKRSLAVELDLWADKPTPSLPDTVDGISILTREAKPSRQVDACVNSDQYFKNVPGGVLADAGGGGNGTICSKVNDYDNGGYALLTAAHLAPDNCTSDITGTSLYQHGSDGAKKFAEVVDYDATKDWMVAKITNSNYSYTNKIKYEDSTRDDIQGWKTQSGLESLVGNPVRKMGIATGYTNADLKKIGISGTDAGCTDWNGDGFRASTNTYDGDSGGPVWDQDADGDTWMVGICLQSEGVATAKTTCNGNWERDNGEGYQAEAFINSTPYNFGYK